MYHFHIFTTTGFKPAYPSGKHVVISHGCVTTASAREAGSEDCFDRAEALADPSPCWDQSLKIKRRVWVTLCILRSNMVHGATAKALVEDAINVPRS